MPVNELVACLIVYNEAEMIERCLRSVVPHVAKTVLIDGVFQRFPHTVPYSTDGTLTIAEHVLEEFGKPYVIESCSEPWRSEMEKRTAYLKHVPLHDYILWVDADFEFCFTYGAADALQQGIHDGYRVELLSHDSRGFFWRLLWLVPPILFRKYDALTYRFNHYTLYDSQGCLAYLPPRSIGDLSHCIKIWHHHEERTQTRMQDRDAYYLAKREVDEELASGIERFYCWKCDRHFTLPEASRIACPTCGNRVMTFKYEGPSHVAVHRAARA